MSESDFCSCAERRLQTHDLHEEYLLLLDAPDNPCRHVRPREPSESWEKLVSSEEIDGQNSDCSVEELTSSELDTPTLELNDFLFSLEKESDDVHELELNRKIRDFVCSSMEEMLKNLEQKFPENFENSKVHTVGSIGEGTKIGLYEEFDFMIEVPALGRRLRQEVQSLEFMTKESRGNVMKGMKFLNECRAELLQQLTSSLHKSWAVHTGPPVPNKNITTILIATFTPTPESTPINISCDIVFCLSLTRKTGCQPTCNICGKQQDDRNMYILDGMFFVKTDIFMEKDKLLNSDISANARRVYRLTKLLVRQLLPPFSDIRRVSFGDVIPSYYLKQIILFTMTEFPKPESWREELLGLRVTQVMLKLQNCVEKEMVACFFNPRRGVHKDVTDESRVAKQYLPMITNLLTAATKGDNSALSSLDTLHQITTEFKQSAITEAKLFGFCHIIVNYCYKGITEPYILEKSCMNMLLEFSRKHLKGIMELREEDEKLLIQYGEEEFSLLDFYKRFMMVGGFLDIVVWSTKFPDRWKLRYNGMLEQRMPKDVLKSITKQLDVDTESSESAQGPLSAYYKHINKKKEDMKGLLGRLSETMKRFNELKNKAGPKEDLNANSEGLESKEPLTGQQENCEYKSLSNDKSDAQSTLSVKTSANPGVDQQVSSAEYPLNGEQGQASPGQRATGQVSFAGKTGVQQMSSSDSWTEATSVDYHEPEASEAPDNQARDKAEDDQLEAISDIPGGDEREVVTENPERHLVLPEDKSTDDPGCTSKSPLTLLREANGRYVFEYDMMIGEQLAFDIFLYSQDLIQGQCDAIGS